MSNWRARFERSWIRLIVPVFCFLAASAPAGAQWTTGGPAGAAIRAVATDTAIPGLVFASAGPDLGVYVSTDSGAHWSGPALGSNDITALGTSYGQIAYAASSRSGIFQSLDKGASWQTLVNPLSPPGQSVTRLLASPCDRSTVAYYAFREDVPSTPPSTTGGLRRSVDGGRSWLDVSPVRSVPVVIAIDGRDQCRLYAWAQQTGTYQSSDRGATWTLVQSTIKSAQLLVADPTAAQTLYAAVLDASGVSRFLRSVDGGRSFSELRFTAPSTITDVAVDPVNGRTLFVATASDGVFRSSDGGASFQAINDGLATRAVTSLAIDSAGRVLHAGTNGGGVFELALPAADTLALRTGHPFDVRVSATDQRTGRVAPGLPIPENDAFGFFSLPGLTGDPGNPEVFVKVLDGTAFNGEFWVFYSGLTDLEYTLTVTERATGKVKTYVKPAGSAAGGFDTSAFP
jgi:photosystem II stability/assembly factor-like uncharacterized protein